MQRRRPNPKRRAKSLRTSRWNSSSMTSLTRLLTISLPPRKSTTKMMDFLLLLVDFFFPFPSSSFINLCFCRLQDLSDRDMAKQEREKTLNSLEAFIFETQVSTENDSHAGRCHCFSFLMCLHPDSGPLFRTRFTRMNTCWLYQRRRRNRSPANSEKLQNGWMRMATPPPPSSCGRSCRSSRACAKTCSSGWRSDASGPTTWLPSTAC